MRADPELRVASLVCPTKAISENANLILVATPLGKCFWSHARGWKHLDSNDSLQSLAPYLVVLTPPPPPPPFHQFLALQLTCPAPGRFGNLAPVWSPEVENG